MEKIDKNKLCDEIYELVITGISLILPIEEEYRKHIDELILTKLPIKCGNIIKQQINNGEYIYFIYKGIRKENMMLVGCDSNGIENNLNTQCHWTAYNQFQIHK